MRSRRPISPRSLQRAPAWLAAASLAFAATLAAAEEVDPGLRERLATASAERGAEAFEICAACHAAERDEEASIGPNLWGVVNRPVASEPGFDYSDALLALGGTWTVERLEKLIENPNAVVPGNTMRFYGVRDPQERIDILAYLLTLRDEGGDDEAAPGEAQRQAE
jgi:cytochrome c